MTPYSGVPKRDTARLDRAVQAIMRKGHSKSSAIAIARSSMDLGEEDMTFREKMKARLSEVCSSKDRVKYAEAALFQKKQGKGDKECFEQAEKAINRS